MSLTERRAADRATMTHKIMDLVRSHGFTCDMDDGLGSRELWVNIQTLNGLALTITFDGASAQPDTHVLSWHGVYDPHKLADGLGWSVNAYHRHKATDICDGFEALYSVLDRRLAAIKEGKAFQ